MQRLAAYGMPTYDTLTGTPAGAGRRRRHLLQHHSNHVAMQHDCGLCLSSLCEGCGRSGQCVRACVRSAGVRLQGILGVPQINASLGAKSGGLENIAPLVAKQAEMLEALGCVCMPQPVRFGEATAAMARAHPWGPSQSGMRRPHASGEQRPMAAQSRGFPVAAPWLQRRTLPIDQRLLLHALLA